MHASIEEDALADGLSDVDASIAWKLGLAAYKEMRAYGAKFARDPSDGTIFKIAGPTLVSVSITKDGPGYFVCGHCLRRLTETDKKCEICGRVVHFGCLPRVATDCPARLEVAR